MIVEVWLSNGSWYGHPEQRSVEMLYNRSVNEAQMQGYPSPGDEWVSPLVCWDLIDDRGIKVGRAYEPTELTPRWVFCDEPGNNEIERPLTHEQLVALIVAYRLRGGPDVDALHLQA
jgi:hypothetical protein